MTERDAERAEDFPEAMEQGRQLALELNYEESSKAYERALKAAHKLSGADQVAARLAYAETCLVIGRWDRAQRELQRVLDGGEGITELDRLRAHLLLGDVMTNRGEPDQAREHYRAALVLAEALGENLWVATAQCELGAIAGQTGELDQARQLLESAQEKLPDLEGVEELRASILSQLGLYYFRLARGRQAEDTFEQAREAVRGLGRPSLEEANIIRYLGVMAGLRGDHRRALSCHLEALKVFEQAGSRYGQAKVYDSIGRTFLAVNRMEEAIFSFKKSEAICRRLGANSELATLYGKLGQVFMLREDYESAVKYFRRDLDISSRFRNYYALGYSYRNLGRCLIQLAEYDEATLNLSESIGLFQYVEDWINLGRVYMDLCLAHVKAGKPADARDACGRARAIFEEHAMNKELAFLNTMSGCIARLEKDFDEAEKRFKTCIAELSGGAGAWLAETWYELGVLYRVMDRNDDAVEAFKNALRIARQGGLVRQTSRYLQDLEQLNEVELFKTWMEDFPASPPAPIPDLPEKLKEMTS